MMSVPAKWSELYFDVFAILCVIGEIFVIWYEVTRRPPEADIADVAANALARVTAVGVVAAIQAFLILKARDGILRTWEHYKQERFDRGLEQGREQGLEQGIEQGIEQGREQGSEETLGAVMQFFMQEEGSEISADRERRLKEFVAKAREERRRQGTRS